MNLRISNQFTFLLLALLWSVCPIFGQTATRIPLTPDAYDQWSTMHDEQISSNGNWFAYSLQYSPTLDTTFVETANGKYKFVFPNAHAGKFEGNWFSCLQNDTLQLIQLQHKTAFAIPQIVSYQWAINDQLIMHLEKDGEKYLKILNKEGLQTYQLDSVDRYYVDPSASQLLLVQKKDIANGIILLDLNKGTSSTVYQNVVGNVSNVTWQPKGDIFAFLVTDNKQQTLQTFDYIRKQQFELKIQATVNKTVFQGNDMMRFTTEGDALLFWVIPPQVPFKESIVNVWNAMDDEFLSRRKIYGSPPIELSKWNLETDTFKIVENAQIAFVSPDGLFAIRKDASLYVPTVKENPDADYYYMDLQTGAETLIIKQYGAPKTMTLVRDGSALLYFKDSNWWMLRFPDFAKKNITAELSSCFVSEKFTYADSNEPVALPILSTDGEQFILYDTHDIWLFNCSSKKPIRLSQGREDDLIYRLADANLRSEEDPFWILGSNKQFSTSQNGVVEIRATDYSRYGFSILQKGSTISKIKLFDKEIRVKAILPEKTTVFYTEQDVNQSPQLTLYNWKTQKKKIVTRTNKQQVAYHWSTSQFVKYKNKEGKLIKGVLLFPANYDQTKKYPMIVQIYEQQGFSYHRYVNPSYYNGDGFNATNFTSNGYFVFRPDILYKIGDPALSALDCVQAGVNAVLQQYPVDAEKIGLIGHSFGGYETNFIITQTNLFKTAVSGASITDLNSKYFSIIKGQLVIGMDRIESQQFRMGGSLFSNRSAYRRNSPVEYVEKINTPLLSWTGEQDTNVDPSQTTAFYLALRRLQKPHIMLSYPTENHVFTTSEMQTDLTLKIEQWFAYWLKGGEKKPWMELNYQYSWH